MLQLFITVMNDEVFHRSLDLRRLPQGYPTPDLFPFAESFGDRYGVYAARLV